MTPRNGVLVIDKGWTRNERMEYAASGEATSIIEDIHKIDVL